jgi:hypothetical protein
MDRGEAIRYLGVVLVGAGLAAPACSRETEAMTPDKIEKQYGVTGAYSDTIATPDGALKGTVVPVTLADGRRAQLVIPTARADEPHGAYIRDEAGLHPVQINDGARRDEVIERPKVVQHRVEPDHPRKRSWERDALIIGGSAGAGTAIGAVAGGKKGAAVGATAGGIGGLIYDLATRDRR